MRNRIPKIAQNDNVLNNNDLNARPSFYQSLVSTTPFVNRGLGFHFDTNLPYVQEIITQRRTGTGNLTFLFKNSYPGIPVVNGVINVNNQYFFTIPLQNSNGAFPAPYVTNYQGNKTQFVASITTASPKDVVIGRIRVYNIYIDKYGFIPSL